ncbi:MAG: allophycocyanin, partial [Cyanobacteria bacterium KgW148]|nr:allophycocyanin [Cyanobacteria bacterium KgW148]
IRCMKNVASSLLSAEDAAEAGFYFDFVVSAMQ